MSVSIKLGEPVIVAQGPAWSEAGWGPYQFPGLFRLDDGRILYTFRNCKDSETTYSQQSMCRISDDEGETWEDADLREYAGQIGIRLPNGERLWPYPLTQIPLDEIRLPEPIGTNNRGHQVYMVSEIEENACNHAWKFYRTPCGSDTPVVEECRMNWPFMTARSCFGVFVPPAPRGLMHMGPDGTLWIAHYDQCVCNPENGGFVPYSSTFLFRSVDMGHTWSLVSTHLYDPDTNRDPDAYRREGYDENDIAFSADGSLIQVVRTASYSPCWFFRSPDLGKTWDPVRMFDNKGVYPKLLTLGNGVILSSYGRPGVWLRASDDPSGRNWDPPIELVPPTEPDQCISCCYTYLLPIDDHSALVAYSDFRVPDRDGNPKKTMMIRRVSVE